MVNVVIIIGYPIHLQLFSSQWLLSYHVSIFNSFLYKDFCPNKFLPCPSWTLFFTRTFVQTSSYRVHLQLFSLQGLLSKQILTVSIFNSFLDKDFCPTRFCVASDANEVRGHHRGRQQNLKKIEQHFFLLFLLFYCLNCFILTFLSQSAYNVLSAHFKVF